MTQPRPHGAGGVPLSVIMPVYNEEGAIALALAEVQAEILDRVPGGELVVVNDGSRDRTPALLDDAAAKDARIRVVHQENRGHGGALLTGLGAARGDALFLIDSDRQIPLDDFMAAWRQLEAGRDAVFGRRTRRQDPALRLQLTKLIRKVIALLFGVEIFDANVPYKLLRRSIWREASACIPPGTLAPSLFLALFVRLRGFDVAEIDVAHRERETGEVSIRRLKLLRFCARAFRQMLQFRRCERDGRRA